MFSLSPPASLFFFFFPSSSWVHPSLCIISAFVFTLCSIQSSKHVHSYRHHAILVLILMSPISLLPRPCHFFFLPLPHSPASWETQRRLISASLPVAHGPSSTSLTCIERSPHASHALHFHLLPLLIPRTALYVAVLVHHLFFPHAPAFDRECNKSRRSSHT